MNTQNKSLSQQKSANKINKCATNESYCIKKEKPVSFSTQPAVMHLCVLSFLIKINNCSSRDTINNFTKKLWNTPMNTQNKSLSQQKSAKNCKINALAQSIVFMRVSEVLHLQSIGVYI